MLKTIIVTGLAAICGLLLGAFASVKSIGIGVMDDTAAGTVVDGVWRTDFDIGSENASGALRARIAQKGLFALSRKEAVYYTRGRDESGRLLDSSCFYTLSGEALPAEWWSITLYDENSFLAQNKDRAPSINRDKIVPSTGPWSATIGPTRPADAANWISTAGSSRFDLTLRLYRPDLDVVMSEKASGFPRIVRTSCEGA
ncbi:MAG: DUF1214 domain-containing protein [Pseudomonadota bacterium]